MIDKDGTKWLTEEERVIKALAEVLLLRALVEEMRQATYGSLDKGKDWEKVTCRLCIGSWRPGAEEFHYDNCFFRKALTEDEMRKRLEEK